MAHIAFAAFAGLQAISSIQQGRFTKAKSEIDAQFAVLKGRQNALNYGKQALGALETQRKMQGTIIASGAAGGVDPFSGSVMTVDQYNAFKAGEEYNLGLENADMAIAGGLAQSQALRAAGDWAMKQAYVNAAASVAMGVYGYNELAPGPGSNLTAPTGPQGLAPASSLPTYNIMSNPTGFAIV
jgi:hypothetical protein